MSDPMILTQNPIVLILAGAVALLLGVVVGIEWHWIRYALTTLTRGVVATCARTFTKAGDRTPDDVTLDLDHTCIDCRRWTLTAQCVSCGRVHEMARTRCLSDAPAWPTPERLARIRAIDAFEQEAAKPYRRRQGAVN